jgi:predicted dehydrogenase
MGVRKTFSNYEELLRDREVDAVIVSLPTHLHLDCARQAAEMKKDLFLEKPIAPNVEEAKEIIAVSRRNGVRVMVGYPFRFRDDFQRLKKQLDAGILGDVEIASATYVSSGPFFHRAEGYPVPVPEWWFNKTLTGGGALVDLGSHIINLLRWYFGEITDMKAHLKYRFNMDFEDGATCLARFKSGTVASITVGWFSQEYLLKLDLYGTVKHSRVANLRRNPLSTAIETMTRGTSEFHRPHFVELQYFVDCLTHDLPPSPSAEDGVKDLEAIMMAYRNRIFLKDREQEQ